MRLVLAPQDAATLGFAPQTSFAPVLRDAVIQRNKPRLRGWSHALAALASLAFVVLLLWPGVVAPARLAPLLVYGASMVELYAVSAVFHIGGWRGVWHQRIRLMDHSSIFVAIAGAATPTYSATSPSAVRTLLLASIWLLALAGITLKCARPHLARGVSVALYLAMGGVAFLPYLAIVAPAPGSGGLPLPANCLLLIGGALYVFGALVYQHRWLDLWPRVWGFHEWFHLCVVAANVACAVAVAHWIVPVW